jgi:hypothetical protein
MSGTVHVGTAALGCPTWPVVLREMAEAAESQNPFSPAIVELIGVLRLRIRVRKRTQTLRSG